MPPVGFEPTISADERPQAARQLRLCEKLRELTLQRTILRALSYLLRTLPDDETYDVPKHVTDLLTPDLCISVLVMMIT